MKDKNMGIAVMTLVAFVFLGIMLSPVSVVIKLGVGSILGLAEAWMIYKLNIFNEESDQKMLDALSNQQQVLNKLIETVQQQGEKLHSQSKEITGLIQENHKEASQTHKEINEKMTNEFTSLIQRNHTETLQTHKEMNEKMANEFTSLIQGNHTETLQTHEEANEKTIKEITKLSAAVISQERSATAMLGQVEQLCEEQKKMLSQLMSNYETVNALMQDKQNQVMNAFEEAIKQIKKIQRESMESLEEVQKETIENLQESMGQHLDELDENVEEYIDQIIDSVKKSQKTISEDLQDTNVELVESIDKYLGNIKEAMQEMLKQYEEVKVYIETLQNGLIDLNEKDMEILKKYLK